MWVDSNSIDPPNSPAGKKAPVQQRRPLPAAESGRSCWGCGQQDARAAQGTMQPLGAATRAPFLRGSRNPPAPAKNSSIRTGYWSFCFICRTKGTQGWIRTATATTAASGRNREELLGLRPAGCACRPRHDAAAGSRDPGSFSARLATSARTHIASVPDL